MTEQRNSTNFLRFLAIALVINSHMDLLYPKRLAFLATGGMMGNALFFMLSSWGLLLSMKTRQRSFGEWYGRRIIRLYPAVWIAVLLFSFPSGIYHGWIRADNLLDQMNKFFYPPFWFLQALMIYYCIIFFIIKKYSLERLTLVTAPVLAFYVVYYVFWLNLNTFSIEGMPFRLLYYFLVALWGVYLGSQNEKIKYQGPMDVLLLVVSVSCIYGHKFLMQHGSFVEYQFVQHAASFPMLYYFAKVASCAVIRDRVMAGPYLGKALTFISGMTLELFMVNNSLDFLDSRLGVFPVNVIALLGINIVLALLIFYCAKPIRRALEDKVSEPQLPKAKAAFAAERTATVG